MMGAGQGHPALLRLFHTLKLHIIDGAWCAGCPCPAPILGVQAVRGSESCCGKAGLGLGAEVAVEVVEEAGRIGGRVDAGA